MLFTKFVHSLENPSPWWSYISFSASAAWCQNSKVKFLFWLLLFNLFLFHCFNIFHLSHKIDSPAFTNSLVTKRNRLKLHSLWPIKNKEIKDRHGGPKSYLNFCLGKVYSTSTHFTDEALIQIKFNFVV